MITDPGGKQDLEYCPLVTASHVEKEAVEEKDCKETRNEQAKY